MRTRYVLYAARRRRRRVLGVAVPLTAMAAVVALIVSAVAGGHDPGRHVSRRALRLPARSVAGWVPPALAPVSVAGQPGRVRQFIARRSDHSPVPGSSVGGSDGAVVRDTGRFGQRFGGD